MLVRILIAVLLAVGLCIIVGVNPAALLRGAFAGRRTEARPQKQTAAQFVRELEGKKKVNLIQRSLRESRNALVIIGQGNSYRRVLVLATLAGIGGALAGLLLFRSILLLFVLGIGCGLIPLWMTMLSVYAHTKHVNDVLETSLSMITIGYTRHNDVLRAVSDAVEYAEEPVRGVLRRFVATVTTIDADVEGAIRQMKEGLDNVLFHQWCDILLLCQGDHTLKAGLLPIVNRIADLKAQQGENETQMMMPMREVFKMVTIVCGFVALLYVMMPDWYGYLAYTAHGQVALSGTAILIFASLHKAIKLSKPLDYRV